MDRTVRTIPTLPPLMMKRLLVLGILALALTAPAAGAQRASHRGSGPIELGIDGGVTFGLDNPKTTIVALPTQVFRLGYFLNDNVEIEPRVSINSASGGGVFDHGVLARSRRTIPAGRRSRWQGSLFASLPGGFRY